MVKLKCPRGWDVGIQVRCTVMLFVSPASFMCIVSFCSIGPVFSMVVVVVSLVHLMWMLFHHSPVSVVVIVRVFSVLFCVNVR